MGEWKCDQTILDHDQVTNCLLKNNKEKGHHTIISYLLIIRLDHSGRCSSYGPTNKKFSHHLSTTGSCSCRYSRSWVCMCSAVLCDNTASHDSYTNR